MSSGRLALSQITRTVPEGATVPIVVAGEMPYMLCLI